MHAEDGNDEVNVMIAAAQRVSRPKATSRPHANCAYTEIGARTAAAGKPSAVMNSTNSCMRAALNTLS